MKAESAVSDGKFRSRKFMGMLLGVATLLLVVLLTYFKLPENPQAWAYLNMLTPFVFALIGAYVGVQGWIDRSNGARKPDEQV